MTSSVINAANSGCCRVFARRSIWSSYSTPNVTASHSAFGRAEPRRLRHALRRPALLRLQERQDLLHGRLGGEAVLLAENIHGPVLDELIGPADAHDGRFDAGIVEVLDDGAAETVV